jgi:hypothetical protein
LKHIENNYSSNNGVAHDILQYITNNDNDVWFETEDAGIVSVILSSYSDNMKMSMLKCMTGEMSKERLIEKCNIPKSSGYRKHRQLVNNGLLIPVDKRSYWLYDKLLSKVNISISGGQTVVRFKINKKAMKIHTPDKQ